MTHQRDQADDAADAPRDEAEPGDAGEPAGPVRSDVDRMIANARRRHGAAGAVLAAGMLGLDQAMGRKPREEAPIVMAASDEPIDIDADGIVVPVDEVTSVHAPAQPRPDPFAPRPRRRRRR